jgi:pyridoxal phosphate enzyme (YggS family)
MKDIFAKNLLELNGQIAEACDRYNRDADDITVVAVTKTFPNTAIHIAVASGIHNIGESRVQEAEQKITEVGQIARFHLIGHLQTNKVKKAVNLFDMIQSVDSLKLAEEIERRAAEAGRTIDCLIEVNCSGENAKYGGSPNETLILINHIKDMPHINLSGLMTIGPFTDDEEQIRDAFRLCYKIFKKGQLLVGEEFDTLSMGMSGDFPLAIAEGATMIRVGSVLFGQRNNL